GAHPRAPARRLHTRRNLDGRLPRLRAVAPGAEANPRHDPCGHPRERRRRSGPRGARRDDPPAARGRLRRVLGGPRAQAFRGRRSRGGRPAGTRDRGRPAGREPRCDRGGVARPARLDLDARRRRRAGTRPRRGGGRAYASGGGEGDRRGARARPLHGDSGRRTPLAAGEAGRVQRGAAPVPARGSVVTGDELARLLEEGSVTLVDVRSPEEFSGEAAIRAILARATSRVRSTCPSRCSWSTCRPRLPIWTPRARSSPTATRDSARRWPPLFYARQATTPPTTRAPGTSGLSVRPDRKTRARVSGRARSSGR